MSPCLVHLKTSYFLCRKSKVLLYAAVKSMSFFSGSHQVKAFSNINYYAAVKVDKLNWKEIKKRSKHKNLLLVMKRQAGIDGNNFVKELRYR